MLNKIKAKNIFKNWLTPALGIIIFSIIISQISLNDFLNVITKADFKYLLPAIIVAWTSTFFRTMRYGIYFPAPGRWIRLYGTFAIGRVSYYVLPFNSGELVYMGLLKKNKFAPTIAEMSPVWFLLRITDIIAFSIWFLVALTFIPFNGVLYQELYSYRLVMIVAGTVLVAFILTLPFWINKIKFKFSNPWIFGRISAFKAGLSRTFNLKQFFAAIVVALLIWMSIISFSILAQFTFNTPLSLSECFLASIAALAITILPINPPMGLGTGDAAWVGIMMLAGANSTYAISFAISIRLLFMMIIFLEGLIGFLITSYHQKRSLRNENFK